MNPSLPCTHACRPCQLYELTILGSKEESGKAHTWGQDGTPFSAMHVRVCVSVRLSVSPFSSKNTIHWTLGLPYSRVITSQRDDICKDPISKQGHVHKYGSWDLNRVPLGGRRFNPGCLKDLPHGSDQARTCPQLPLRQPCATCLSKQPGSPSRNISPAPLPWHNCWLGTTMNKKG